MNKLFMLVRDLIINPNAERGFVIKPLVPEEDVFNKKNLNSGR